MTDKLNRFFKPKKMSDDQPVFDTTDDLFMGGTPPLGGADNRFPPAGLPPMGKLSSLKDGKLSENRKMPLADVTWVKRKYLDVAYALQSPAQKLDVYLPDTGDTPFPVIFYIHGGGWQICDKRDAFVLDMLKGLRRGYAVIAINYRLSGEAIFPAQIYDLKTALRYIKANADDYLLDKHRIAAWGASSGGHLAALLGTSVGVAELEDFSTGFVEENTEVIAVIDWFGPTQNFLKMDTQLIETGNGKPDHSQKESPESCLLGEQITLVPELVEKASPMTYIRLDVPYFLIQHGYHDQLVPVQQSINFAAQLESIAGKDKVILDVFMDHIYHADPYFNSEENLSKVYAFLDSHLR